MSALDAHAARTIAEIAGETARFTDHRVPDAGIRALFAERSVWQARLDVEAALARAEARLGIIPASAADRITACARVEALDAGRIAAATRVQAHPLVPLVEELTRVVGGDAAGWVHWGATTQNIMQTGMALLLRDAHAIVAGLVRDGLRALADLAERSAEMIMPGRTHGQHAVPITFGLKAATWIEDLLRALERIERGVEPCLRVMMGGAVGSFASLGERGPEVQALVAEHLGLGIMPIPSRAVLSPQSGYVGDLAILAAVCARVAVEVETLMGTEFGEVSEPVPPGSVGSSTMPHKRNPKLAPDMIELSALIRALAPEAVQAIIHPHEADSGATAALDGAIEEALVKTGDLLARLRIVVAGLELFPVRMRRNLQLSGSMLGSESVMLALGERIGRDEAHRIVYEHAMRAATEGLSFEELLVTDPRVTAQLGADRVVALLDPSAHVGLSPRLAREAAARAREAAG